MPSPNTLRNLTGCIVDNGSLHLEKLVGAGSFGKLYRACDTGSTRPSSWASSSSDSSIPSTSSSSSKVYAVKCLERPRLDSPKVKLTEREWSLHLRVSDHPNIVTFHRRFVDNEHEYFVMDFHGGGDMYHAIGDSIYYKDTPLIKRTFAGIVDAVLFCHRQGIYHRDIKPDNVLVDVSGGNPCLTDFGLATTSFLTHSKSGTEPYMTPESFHSAYSPARSDTWALSITLINLVTGHSPWSSASPYHNGSFKKQYLSDPEKHLRGTLPISRQLASLLMRSLCLDPGQRISMGKFVEELQQIEDLFISDEDLATASSMVSWAARRPSRAAHVPTECEALAPARASTSKIEHSGPHEAGPEYPPGLPPPTVAPPPRASGSSMPEDPSRRAQLPPLRPHLEAIEPTPKRGKVKRLMRGLRFWRKSRGR